MKTFVETEGKKTLDWNEFLNRETRTDEEWEEATDIARQQLQLISNNPAQDFIMAMFLCDLHANLYLRDLKRAKKSFQRIEKRKNEDSILSRLSQLNTTTP